MNREATLLLGAGPRALLLQIAHPLIAEGVDQHSDFRTDPWRRLRATLRSYLAIVYGTTTEARAEIRRLHRLHGRIHGPVHDDARSLGDAAATYDAHDPDLALWVHATLIDATLVTYEAWIRPLHLDERARFYAETLPIGRALGIPADRLPPDIAAFNTYVARQLSPGGPIRVTPTARSLASAILAPPLGPPHPLLGRAPTSIHAWLLWPAVGLLPAWIRDAYGLRWGRRERVVAGWLVAGFRAWRPCLPADWRTMPQALAADARLDGRLLGRPHGRLPHRGDRRPTLVLADQ